MWLYNDDGNDDDGDDNGDDNDNENNDDDENHNDMIDDDGDDDENDDDEFLWLCEGLSKTCLQYIFRVGGRKPHWKIYLGVVFINPPSPQIYKNHSESPKKLLEVVLARLHKPKSLLKG